MDTLIHLRDGSPEYSMLMDYMTAKKKFLNKQKHRDYVLIYYTPLGFKVIEHYGNGEYKEVHEVTTPELLAWLWENLNGKV